jgi:hypothetical protein
MGVGAVTYLKEGIGGWILPPPENIWIPGGMYGLNIFHKPT